MKNNKKIIDKICKCLRLSESSNPNEAALALRQATRLMDKYGVSNRELITAEVAECSTQLGEQYTPPFWALALANLVAEAFQCRNLISRCYGRRPEFHFIGLDFKAEVATYSYTVLYRHLLKAIDDFEVSLKEEVIGDESEYHRRVDVFAQAWLFRAGRMVTSFSNGDSDKKVIDEYISEKYGETVELASETAGADSADYNDILHGMRAANNIALYRSVKRFSDPLFLHHQQVS